MMDVDFATFLDPAAWHRPGRGPRYQQLARHLDAAIVSGNLAPETQLPPERDMAERAGVSRVTVRKAMAELAARGLVAQRQGSGSFVSAPRDTRLQQSLSSLVSFTEIMQSRGFGPSSKVLSAGIFAPGPKEMLVLGLPAAASVARIKRLRLADPGALAIETSAVPQDVLPDPGQVQGSLYAVLRQTGQAPVRAIQQIAAVNLSDRDAALLGLPEGHAVLQIERTGYLESGRPIEYTTGLYRSDIYEFVTEVRLERD